MLIRKTFNSRDAWLSGRTASIGASEAAASVGLSPFKTPLELWNEKTGRSKQKDLSSNRVVQYGHDAEKYIRGLFLCDHTEFSCDYNEFDILSQDNLPYITATLDGELTNNQNGLKGILEIKTAEVFKKTASKKWDRNIPEHYYIQILHQFIAAGEEYTFSYLSAKLKKMDGDSEIRNYEFQRDYVEEDINWLLEKETKFWWYVENDKIPPVSL